MDTVFNEAMPVSSRRTAMIVGLDHFQITVPKNAEREARTFYCDVLGLQEIEKPENRKANGGFWLKVGALAVHVGLENGVERTHTKTHVAYRVDSLENWRKKLVTHGFAVKDSLPFPDAKAFEFRDPFGNRIEIIEKF